jgi:hypothetical protein
MFQKLEIAPYKPKRGEDERNSGRCDPHTEFR